MSMLYITLAATHTHLLRVEVFDAVIELLDQPLLRINALLRLPANSVVSD